MVCLSAMQILVFFVFVLHFVRLVIPGASLLCSHVSATHVHRHRSRLQRKCLSPMILGYILHFFEPRKTHHLDSPATQEILQLVTFVVHRVYESSNVMMISRMSVLAVSCNWLIASRSTTGILDLQLFFRFCQLKQQKITCEN